MNLRSFFFKKKVYVLLYMSNHNHDPWKPVKDNEIFKYIFINRDNRIAFPDTKVGGDLEVTGSLTLPFIDNTIIGSTTPSSATFTTATISTAQVTTSLISGNQDISGNLIVEGETLMKGNVTITGTTTTYNAVNTVIKDTIFELGAGFNLTPESTRDSGIIFQRGTESNLFFGWDESVDKFVLGLTNADGSSETVQITSYSTLKANLDGSITGNSESVTNGIYTTDVGTITNTILGENSVSTTKIQDNTITLSKLITLGSGQLIVGNSSNRPTARTITGDVTMSSSGVLTIGNDKIINSYIPLDTITINKLNQITRGSIIVGGVDNVAEMIRFCKSRNKYITYVDKPLTLFPSNNSKEDALIINKSLEKLISRDLNQYMWSLRLFQTRPDGKKFPYAR